MEELKKKFLEYRKIISPRSIFNGLSHTDNNYKNLIEIIRKLVHEITLLEGPNLAPGSDIEKLNRQIFNLYDNIVRIINNYEASMEIIKEVEQILKEEYPGIFEFFDYLYEYYKAYKITYPSFLGWQTVLEDSDTFIPQKNQNGFARKINKSKSFPIQASGAEFIRQWLIEISQVAGYANAFHIVNVIHDQIDLEIPEGKGDYYKVILEDTKNTAAQKVGIDPETIHLK
jgi:hypothetical protein